MNKIKLTVIVLTLVLASHANTSYAYEFTGVLLTGLTGSVNETLTGIVVNPPIITPIITTGSSYSSGGGGGGSYVPVSVLISTTTSTSTLTIASTTIDGCISGNLYSPVNGKLCTVIDTTGKVLGASIFKFTKTLRKGVTSDDVKELQNRLRTEKFFTLPSSTRFFGSITFNAVKKYQKAHKLPSTGFVGPLTVAELDR
ncbi:MAG: peptidoglycan-binding domain-containing protein [bacterium]